MFDLMKLPPELRIKIYEHALVRDVIRIVSTVHPLGAMHPKRYENLSTWYDDSDPKTSLRLRTTQTKKAMSSKFVSGREVADLTSWSYGIQPSTSPPLVNIFLINRQVYFEAWPIFYEQNAFAFAIPTNSFLSSVVCLSFLYDRPHHALRHIREMHLLIGNEPHLPIRFQLWCEPWQFLLDEINRYLSIRVLVLYIRGVTDDALSYHSPDLPWRNWLYKMNGLQKLDIDIAGESTHEANLALAKQMRSKMVLGGEQMGIEGITLGQRSLKYFDDTIDEPVNTLSTSAEILDLEENY